MGFIDDPMQFKPFHKKARTVFHLKKTVVPLCILPDDIMHKVSEHDTDSNNWLEDLNNNGVNEFSRILGLDLNKYKMTKSQHLLSDGTYIIEYKLNDCSYIKEKHTNNYSREFLKDNEGNLLVEKIYNNDIANSLKIVYKNMGSGSHKFQVIQEYKYDGNENNGNDLIIFANNKNHTELTKGETFIQERFKYNGKYVEPNLVKYDEETRRYTYNDPESGKILYFTDRYKY